MKADYTIFDRWELDEEENMIRELQEISFVRTKKQAIRHLQFVKGNLKKVLKLIDDGVSVKRAFDIIASEFGYIYPNFRPD